MKEKSKQLSYSPWKEIYLRFQFLFIFTLISDADKAADQKSWIWILITDFPTCREVRFLSLPNWENNLCFHVEDRGSSSIEEVWEFQSMLDCLTTCILFYNTFFCSTQNILQTFQNLCVLSELKSHFLANIASLIVVTTNSVFSKFIKRSTK